MDALAKSKINSSLQFPLSPNGVSPEFDAFEQRARAERPQRRTDIPVRCPPKNPFPATPH
jgi:hypothetical protein